MLFDIMNLKTENNCKGSKGKKEKQQNHLSHFHACNADATLTDPCWIYFA